MKSKGLFMFVLLINFAITHMQKCENFNVLLFVFLNSQIINVYLRWVKLNYEKENNLQTKLNLNDLIPENLFIFSLHFYNQNISIFIQKIINYRNDSLIKW